MNRASLLIPAAGRSQRYVQQGYSTPKPLLEVEHLGTRARMITHVENWLGRRADLVGFPPGNHQNPDFKGRYAGIVSDSQIETISLMLASVDRGVLDGPVILADCDLLVDKQDLEAIEEVITMPGGPEIAVLTSDKKLPGFSRALVDRGRGVAGFVGPDFEISGLGYEAHSVCSLRGFRSGHMLRRSVNWAIARGFDVTMLMDKLSPLVCMVPARGAIIDWGTPDALVKSGARILEERK